MAGSDPLDPHTKEVAVPNYLAMLTGDIRGVRLGIPSNYFFDDVEPAIEKAVRTAIADLESLGAKTVPVSIPDLDGVLDCMLAAAMSEAEMDEGRLGDAWRLAGGVAARGRQANDIRLRDRPVLARVIAKIGEPWRILAMR
jgi:Asp-tRNA(Asn)/Glu-tRNA(Gln) amidotransferase A subunit family amidase